MANVKLAQVFQTSLSSILEQFVYDTNVKSDNINALLNLSQEEFENLMLDPSVPLTGIMPELSWYLMTNYDWQNFGNEDWGEITGGTNFTISKASLFLRVAGTPLPAHQINNGSVIDLSNHQFVTNGEAFVSRSDTGTGGGSMSVISPTGSTDVLSPSGSPTINYPVTTVADVLYHFWFLVSSTTTTAYFDMMVDGQVVYTVNSNLGGTGWFWINVPICIPDRDTHLLAIRPRTAGQSFDKLVVYTGSTTPTGAGPDYTASPFVTCHYQLYQTTSDGTPTTALPVYDWKTTLNDVLVDDWFNFNSSQAFGNAENAFGQYAAVFCTSGGGEGHFVMWDLAKATVGMPAFVYDGSSWNSRDDYNQAILLYTDRATGVRDCGIPTLAAQQFVYSISEFDESLGTFNNTEISDSPYAPSFGLVTLAQPDKNITIICDESGSMTWNDPQGERHAIIQRLLNRISTGYSSEVNFNLLTFGGVPVTPVLFATNINYSNGTPQQVVQDFFKRSFTNIAGVRVVRKVGSYPQTPIDGQFWDGIWTRFSDTGMSEGTDYYYSIFTYQFSTGSSAPTAFSPPVNIQITAATKTVPVGISLLNASVRTGTGVSADEYVIGAWHLDEGDGVYAYDFSSSNLMLQAASMSPRWLTADDVPAGTSGIRFDGVSDMLSGPLTSDAAVSTQVTLMAWVYWYEGQGCIICRETADSSGVNFALSVMGTGRVEFRVSSAAALTSAGSVSQNAWTHVAVSCNIVTGATSFYINGVLDSTQTLTGTTDGITSMKVTIGAHADGSYPFFGRLTEITVHDTVRSGSYIQSQTSLSPTQDNGDRLVAFQWVSDELSNGTAIIVQNTNASPASVSDGQIVWMSSMEAGSHVGQATERFLAGQTYHYRIFVQDQNGNYSLYEDSASALVQMPLPDYTAILPAPTPPLEPPFGFSATPVNKKVLLSWTPPADPRVTGVVIFMWTEQYPTVDSMLVSTGEVVLNADTTQTSYLLYVPQNGVTYYFTIVGINSLGQISSAAYASATPSATDSGTYVPLPPVKGLHFEQINDSSYDLIWTNPQPFLANYSAYYNDPIFIYGMLLDPFGNPVVTPEVSLNVTLEPTQDPGDGIFTPVGLGVPDSTNLFILTTNVGGDGLIRGGMTFKTQDAIQDLVSSGKFSVNIVVQPTGQTAANGSGVPIYQSPSIDITVTNPVSITMTNINSNLVPLQSVTNNEITTTLVPGAYAGCDTPIVLQVAATYRGTTVGQMRLLTAQVETIGSTITTSPITTTSVSGSFYNISVPCPATPCMITYYANINVNGFIRTTSMQLTFVNPLMVQVNPVAPIADGVSVAEQFCSIWMVDPNNPSSTLSVPDLTPVKWTLDATDQPFYSTDNVPLPNGVYSYLRNGVASDVFLGPVSGVSPVTGRQFNITASVVYDGLSATGAGTISVLPRPFSGTIFLSEFPSLVNSLWADGQDYVKLTIVSDPTSTSSVFGDCFISCSESLGNPVITLSAGQQIKISTQDTFQIITGDVIETTINGYPALDVSQATIATQTTNITLSSATTTAVYFRLNKTNLQSQSLVLNNSPCACFSTDEQIIGNLSTVTLTGSMLIGGKVRALRSGGDFSIGLPPAVISAVEPLSLKAVDLRVNGFPSDVFVVDGSSTNEIVFEMTWKNGGVPNGTPVVLEIPSGSTAPITLQATTIYTTSQIDPYLNPNGPARSFCTATVLPTSSASSFQGSILATATYDASGLVSRSQSVLVSILYVVGESEQQTSSAVFNGSSYIYNSGTDVWTQVGAMEHPRGALNLEYANGQYFAIGGTNGRTISQYNESFDGSVWTTVADMITPRAYAMSVAVGTDIYVIGGIAADALDGVLVVSISTEVYSSTADEWTTLADMPTVDTGGATPVSYGVAMGMAFYSNGNIFVVGGINQIDENDNIVSYNDRVLMYEIGSNTWTYSDILSEASLQLAQRLSPFGFVDGTAAYVAGGAFTPPGEVFVPAGLTFCSDAFSMNLAGDVVAAASSIAASDDEFRNLPVGRYKGASVKVGSEVYFLGGSEVEIPNSVLVEEIATSGTPFGYSSAASMPLGLHSFGAASNAGDVLICGGMSSGRDESFVQITLSGSQQMNLDGRDSVTLQIGLKDRNWQAPETVNLLLNTNLWLGESPVLLSSRFMNVEDGMETTVVLPRSDDGENDTISIDAVIQDSVMTGQTVSVQPLPPTSTPSLQFTNATTLNASVTPSGDNRGVFANLQQTADSPFNLLPNIMPQGTTFKINTAQSVDSVPVVMPLLYQNNGSANDVLDAMAVFQDRIPFGGSPMIDALGDAASYIEASNVASVGGNIYVFTDTLHNEEVQSASDVTEALLSLAGSDSYPVVFVNMEVQQPLVTACQSNRSTEPVMDQMAEATGGQSFSVLSATGIDQIVSNVTGRAVGAIGYGTFQYDIDLQERSLVTNIAVGFSLPADSSATWQFASSDEGLVFTPFSDPYESSDTPSFVNFRTRYLRFLVAMSSGLTEFQTASNETQEPAVSPSLDSITITFNRASEDMLFLNTEALDGPMDDVVLAVNADRPSTSDIKVGISTWNNFNWDRFQTATQPAQNQNGKVVLPYRIYQASGSAAQEELNSVDGFLFQASYGRWQPTSSVIVYDSTGTSVNDDTYKVYPDTGAVVFNQRVTGPLFISVTDQSMGKVGIKITNNSVTETASIRGVGFMYTSK